MNDKEWQIAVIKLHPYCELGANGCTVISTVGHHFISKGASEKLRYDLDNGIGLCNNCHIIIHTKSGTKAIIINKRGDDWYNKLIKKRYAINK